MVNSVNVLCLDAENMVRHKYCHVRCINKCRKDLGNFGINAPTCGVIHVCSGRATVSTRVEVSCHANTQGHTVLHQSEPVYSH